MSRHQATLDQPNGGVGALEKISRLGIGATDNKLERCREHLLAFSRTGTGSEPVAVSQVEQRSDVCGDGAEIVGLYPNSSNKSIVLCGPGAQPTIFPLPGCPSIGPTVSLFAAYDTATGRAGPMPPPPPGIFGLLRQFRSGSAFLALSRVLENRSLCQTCSRAVPFAITTIDHVAEALARRKNSDFDSISSS